MKSTHRASRLFLFLAAFAGGRLAGPLFGQEVKVPHAPSAMQDVKTPAPVLPPKEAAPARPPVPLERVLEHGQPQLPAPLAGAQPTLDPDATYFDQPGDGSLWTMGRAYKAQFSPSGVTYYPNLGPSAPAAYPLTFRCTGAEVGSTPIEFATDVAAKRAGDAVQYERGGLIESYAIRSESIEQEFTFASLPGDGDLVVHLAVSTGLAASTTSEGFRFSNDLGHVDYGKAVAIDAQGHRAEATTILGGNSIEIRVPADFVAWAVLPLTIDPVITTFSIDTTAFIDSSPDVAFDVSSARFLVCWERVYSSADHDIWAQQYDSNGILIAGSGAYIDLTASFWGDPRVANNNIANNYEVVATVGSAAPHTIWGRARDSSSTFMNPQVAISAEPSYDCIDPDVGGDPLSQAPTYYMVIWVRGFSGTDTDIHGQVLDGNGNAYGGLVLIDNSGATIDFEPAISKSDGLAPYATQNWTVTWTRQFTFGVDYDIWASQIRWDGTISLPTYSIDYSAAYDYDSQASTVLDGATGDRDYMVVYNRYDGVVDSDLHAQIFNAGTSVCAANLSALDTDVSLDQVHHAVDSDGYNYAVAYTERVGTSVFDYNIFVSTFTRVGSTIKVSEAHQLLAGSGLQDILPSIASKHSGGGSGPRSMVVWEDYYPNGTDIDISGGIYENAEFTGFCSPGIDALPCPCGNPSSNYNSGCNNSALTGGAHLSKTGSASLSGDSVVFTAVGEKPTATSIFAQGNVPLPGGVVFGQGVRCAGGALKRLYVKTAIGGAVTAPTGSDPSVHARSAALGDTISAGESRYYFVYYRDPIVLGGCPATSTFNSTQTGALIWMP